MIDKATENLRALRDQSAHGNYRPQLFERKLPEGPQARTTRPQQQSADLSIISAAIAGMSGFGLIEVGGKVYINCINEGERFAIKVEAPVLVWGRDYLRVAAETIREHSRSSMSLNAIVGGLQPQASDSAPSPEEPEQEAPTIDEHAEPAFIGESTAHEEVITEHIGVPLPGAGSSQETQAFVMPTRDAAKAATKTLGDFDLSPVKEGYVGSLEPRSHWAPSDEPGEHEKVEGWVEQ